MRIGIEKELYFRELTRKESRSLLEEIAKRFFGRTVTVDITKGGATSAAPDPTPETHMTTDPQEKPNMPTLNDPLVQTVLDVLGGEVQGSRSHRPSGEPQ
jgi:hypothetical protein